jgi:hypothetical protein
MLKAPRQTGAKDVNRKMAWKARWTLALAGSLLMGQPVYPQDSAALPGELVGTIQDYDAVGGFIAIDDQRYAISLEARQALSGAPIGATGFRGLSVEYSVTEMPDGTKLVDRLGILPSP